MKHILPRRASRRTSLNSFSASKPIPVLRAQEHDPSPHFLDLKKISARTPHSRAPLWEPNALHNFIAHPISAVRQTRAQSPARSPDSARIKTEKSMLDNIAREAPARGKIPVRAFSRRAPRASAHALSKLLNSARRINALPDALAHACACSCARMRRSLHTVTQSIFARMRASEGAKKTKILSPAPHMPRFLAHPYLRAVSAFLATALLFILPVKVFSAYANLEQSRALLQTEGSAAFQSLSQSGKALLQIDNANADSELGRALALFSETNAQLNKIDPLARLALHLSPAKSAELESALHIMRAGEYASQAVVPIISSVNALKHASDAAPTDTLALFQKNISISLPLIARANKELNAVSLDALPTDKRDKFLTARSYLTDLENDVRTAEPLMELLYAMLGGTMDKRYLVALQNNTELRATGGFIGSFALVDVSRGRIKKIRFAPGGSYDLEGNLKVLVAPPAPIKLLRTRWEFQDANWFPDFPASARKLAWFYEKSGGPTVDGVITLDTNVLLDLLKLTGPMDMSAYHTAVTAENAIATIQDQVEVQYDRSVNTPKQFLGDLIGQVAGNLQARHDAILPLLSLLQNNLAARHIQLMSFDDASEQSILDHDWGGAVKSAEGDYLDVVNSNIGGQKTDAVIEQKLRLNTAVAPDGSAVDTLTIERTHHGSPREQFYGADNIDYVRVLVPEGSVMLNATGFTYPQESMVQPSDKPYAPDPDLIQIEANPHLDEASGTRITAEFHKTVFANWIITKPGETSVATITYRLPFKIFTPSDETISEKINSMLGGSAALLAKYALLVQKQAGMNAIDFAHTLVLPGAAAPVWASPADWKSINDRTFALSATSPGDLFVGFAGRMLQ